MVRIGGLLADRSLCEGILIELTSGILLIFILGMGWVCARTLPLYFIADQLNVCSRINLNFFLSLL
jgi:hypothetical protein